MQSLSDEQKRMVIAALQNEIDGYKKKISDIQAIIKQYTVTEDGSKGRFDFTFKKTRSKDNGWIAKIKHILSNSDEPLTSSEILKRVIAEYPELDTSSNLMGSLSPALNGACGENGEFERTKIDGQFATFKLREKYIL